MNICLNDYLDKYNVIAKHRYGFGHGVSSEHAVANFTGYLINKLDNKQKCYGIFLDLSKTFGTISVTIYVMKLEQIWVHGIVLPFFGINYFT